MRLQDRYNELDGKGRAELAKAARVAPGYLWQIATRWRGKRPSLDTLMRLAAADKKLQITAMVEEFAEKKAAA